MALFTLLSKLSKVLSSSSRSWESDRTRSGVSQDAQDTPAVAIDVPAVKVRSNEADPASETHYVIVVHGTFAKPGGKEKVSWFEIDPLGNDNNFCARLSLLLAEGPLTSEAVWRALPGGASLPRGVMYPFHWDGTNTDQGRKQGAQNLAKLIKHIGKRDPSARVHIIAHSHGGNVTLKAIEEYVQKLGLENTSWPKAISSKFNGMHGQQVAALRKWRKMKGVPWWQRLNPFLVLHRGVQGEKESSELFPWGYYRFWDLCLVLSRSRAKRYLKHRRMTSPLSNVLGKIVFLGTPFYYKHWAARARLKVAFSLTVSFVLCYVITLVTCSFWFATFEQEHFTFGLVAWVAFLISLLLFAAHVITWCEKTLLRSGNMYHSDKVPWSPAMHALVVHAGKLDEAALALCTEPAARAYLLPLIKRAMQSFGWVPFPKKPRRGARISKWAIFIMGIFRTLLVNLLDLLPRSILWAVGKLVVMETFSVLRKVLVGAAFGLQTEDLSTASVYVDQTLVVKGENRNIVTWDVRKLLAEAEALSCGWNSSFSKQGCNACSCSAGSVTSRGCSSREDRSLKDSELSVSSNFSLNGCKLPGVEVASPYAFLWDEERLRAQSDKSMMFNQLKKQLRKIDHSPFLTHDEFERELRGICCVFEQRFLEVRGHFQLAHSTYYKNPVILEALVRFLEKQEVPTVDYV